MARIVDSILALVWGLIVNQNAVQIRRRSIGRRGGKVNRTAADGKARIPVPDGLRGGRHLQLCRDRQTVIRLHRWESHCIRIVVQFWEVEEEKRNGPHTAPGGLAKT